MGVDPLLLEKLVCPKCRGALAQTEDGMGLDCQACRLRYPVERYGEVAVPNMIIEHAKEIGDADEGKGA